jgi:predicted secreted acid phosphatase
MKIPGLTRTSAAAAVTVTATAALVISSPGLATARTVDDSTLTPHTQFTMTVNPYDGTVPAPASGEDIPNIDSVKSTIRVYYNAAKDSTGMWVANKTTSPYITEMKAIEQQILTDLPQAAPANSAVVFDVDATLLADFDFEEATHYNYDGAVSAQWVADHKYPAVPGMQDLVRTLDARGYEIYGVTGRPSDQENDTIANLTEQGFVTSGGGPIFNGDNMYTTGYSIGSQPAYVDCAADGNDASCSTVEKKAFTRKQIEDSTGANVVLNVGDQWSDLMGGYADDTVKLPNPTYFLASPDIAGAPADDTTMAPPTSYTMAPDGSSGSTVASGDDIPNLDPLRKEIRAYYNAPSGIASKSSSPYITEMKSLEQIWTPEVEKACQTASTAIDKAKSKIATTKAKIAKAKKKVAKATTKKAKAKAKAKVKSLKAKLAAISVPDRPAAVFDADDTTLMTYDMEDGAMKFNFDPAIQDSDWVQPQRFPATPGMPELVSDLADAGCAIFGLTGRSDSQKYATLGNLTKAGYSDFRANHYFTKWNSGTQPPAYIDCGSDNTCSTIEYKSQTRAHIEDMGFQVVANFGDQFSDLIGGHAAKAYKLPNPTYYLP